MASFLETLMALNRAGMPPLPEPAQPMQIMPSGPIFAPPNPMPMPAAPVGLPPLDQNLIAQLAGPPPVQQQPGFLDKLAIALQGFGAGVQGQGPQFVQSIAEQRERPQREYQQRRLAGTEVALRRQEQQQAAEQRRADIQADREFKVWLQKTGVTNQEARDRLQQAFALQKIDEMQRIADEKQRIADEKAAIQQKKTEEKEIRLEGNRIFDNAKGKLSQGQSMRIAEGLVRGKTLSVADQAAYDRVPPLGGTGGDQKMAQQFENLKNQLIKAMPIYKPGTNEIVSYGDPKLETNLRNRIVDVGLKLQNKGYEVGLGQYPYQIPPAQKAQTSDRARFFNMINTNPEFKKTVEEQRRLGKTEAQIMEMAKGTF